MKLVRQTNMDGYTEETPILNGVIHQVLLTQTQGKDVDNIEIPISPEIFLLLNWRTINNDV